MSPLSPHARTHACTGACGVCAAGGHGCAWAASSMYGSRVQGGGMRGRACSVHACGQDCARTHARTWGGAAARHLHPLHCWPATCVRNPKASKDQASLSHWLCHHGKQLGCSALQVGVHHPKLLCGLP